MRHVLVTGAGRGIGFEIVKQFLSHNQLNVICISRDVSQLELLNHSNLTIIRGDLVTEYKRVLNSIKELQPSIQILFNNAGIAINKDIIQLTDNDMHELMDINFFTPLKLVRDLKPYFITSSHIINISSMSGFQGSKKMKGLSLYSASKAALGSLTESIAEEFKEDKVFCNCFALGSVDTEMIKISIPGLEPQIDPTKLAAFLHNFALNGHNFSNGQIIPLTLDNL